MPRTKVLIIEDDRSIIEMIRYNLEDAGYLVDCAHDGREGIERAKKDLPDIILLDVMLPIIDGVEVCRRLRAHPDTQDKLIMMISAKSEEVDQLVGFNIGADDYVTKPFSVRILMERIKSLYRRRRSHTGNDLLVAGSIKIDRIKHRVSIDGQTIDLTPSEFRLLDTMMRQPGRAFDRSELIDSALGADTLVLERTIDVHIRSLRTKLGREANRIQTVRGIGYRFAESMEMQEAE